MHLLLPLLASILLIIGLILIKRASAEGARPVTTLFLTNVFTTIALSSLWWFGGSEQPWHKLWQPAAIAVLFMLGLTFTFLAVERGDVSVATPVFGVKVFIVALLLTLFAGQRLPMVIWLAALLATLGVALIQWTGREQPRRVVYTILLALCAATSFATFDVLVQAWSPAWGAGRLLPIIYAIVGLASLGMIPWVDWDSLRKRDVRRFLVPGTILVAIQSACIILTISIFGDAARVNVVYAMRGLWGVGLAWAAARIWGGAEADVSRRVMLTRLTGAGLLTAAVVFAIAAGE